MSDTARLFIGFPVTLESSLQAAVKKLKIGGDRHEMELNWVPSANLHVTTNFLGATPREKIPQIEELLSQLAAREPEFETSLRGLGGFPDVQHMRVLWAGVRKSRALAGFQDRLREELIAAGFAQEDRDFVPHLTLARLRKSRSGTDLLSPFVRTSFQDLRVQNVALFESYLQGSTVGPGPVYKILSQHILSGTAEDESRT